MLSLKTTSLPATAETFREAFEETLGELLPSAGKARITIEDRAYPQVAAIRISLDEVSVGDRFSPPPLPSGAIDPALEADYFQIRANPLRVESAPVRLQCEAHKVKIGQTRDQSGNVFLLVQSAESGEIDLSVGMIDLEKLAQTTVAALARKQGIVVEDLRLHLTAENERTLHAELRVRARKLFLNTQIRVTGAIEIDDQFNARLRDLDCAGEGTLGTLACGFLAPRLDKLSGNEFPLLNLPVGDLKLHDVKLAVGNELRATAKFGSAA